MIIIKAILQAKKGQEKALEAATSAMIPQVQNEPGALVYALHRAADNPGRFFFYEKYADQAAVDFHMATPYLKELLQKVEGLLAEPPDIEFYEEITAVKR